MVRRWQAQDGQYQRALLGVELAGCDDAASDMAVVSLEFVLLRWNLTRTLSSRVVDNFGRSVSNLHWFLRQRVRGWKLPENRANTDIKTHYTKLRMRLQRLLLKLKMLKNERYFTCNWHVKFL